MDYARIKNETFIFSVMWVFNVCYGATPAPNNKTIMHFVLRTLLVTNSTTSKTNIYQKLKFVKRQQQQQQQQQQKQKQQMKHSITE